MKDEVKLQHQGEEEEEVESVRRCPWKGQRDLAVDESRRDDSCTLVMSQEQPLHRRIGGSVKSISKILHMHSMFTHSLSTHEDSQRLRKPPYAPSSSFHTAVLPPDVPPKASLVRIQQLRHMAK